MRILGILLATLLCAPLAYSSEAEPRDALEVSIYTLEETGAIITWSASPGAVGYRIFRGDSPENVVFIGRSATTSFVDETAPAEQVWYVILSDQLNVGTIEAFSPARGTCLKHKGLTGVSLTMAHCLPTRPL